MLYSTTGSPSSKYEHRRVSALLRNILNIRICMGKKHIFTVTYENEKISITKQLTLRKMCVTSLLCGPRADLWPFYGFLCKRFSLYIKANLYIVHCKFIFSNYPFNFISPYHTESYLLRPGLQSTPLEYSRHCPSFFPALRSRIVIIRPLIKDPFL